MLLSKILFAIGTIACACLAQSANISGTVVDSAGNGVPEVAVLLENAGLSDTTDAEGAFSFTTTAISGDAFEALSRPQNADIVNGKLRLQSDINTAVKVATYTHDGRMIHSVTMKIMAGTHLFELPNPGAGIYLHKLAIGDASWFFKSMSDGSTVRGFGTPGTDESASEFSNALSKLSLSQAADVIRISKRGWLNKRVPISGNDTSGMEIEMKNSDAGSVTDIDGNEYRAIWIGNQIWTVDNFKSTKFNDGTGILNIIDSTVWSSTHTPAMTYYAKTSNPDTIDVYGGLYNWHAASHPDIAPEGWHVPTNAEWDTLQNWLIQNGYNHDGTTEGNKIAKALSTVEYWSSSFFPGTPGYEPELNNTSGFSALPNGYRYDNGEYYGLNERSYWWAADAQRDNAGYLRNLKWGEEKLVAFEYLKECGYALRLVKDQN